MPFPLLDQNTFVFKDLEVGQSQSFTVKITERLIDEFASFSGDKNPIHISESEASKSIFKKRVAHGFLISSFFSSMYSNFLPGKGSIILEQQFQFLNPVFIDDLVTYKVQIVELEIKRKIVNLVVSCETCNEVIKGRAKILLLNL